jgi:hypothetical protein
MRICGRFTQHYTWQEIHTFLSVFGPARNLQPHYNIAPTDTLDLIRLDKDCRRELLPMRWGLIPGWWKKSAKEVPATQSTASWANVGLDGGRKQRLAAGLSSSATSTVAESPSSLLRTRPPFRAIPLR